MSTQTINPGVGQIIPPDSTTKAERLRDFKVGVSDVIKIDPRILEIEPGFNPRDYNDPENRAHLDRLKTSIRAQGVRVPLQVWFDKPNQKVWVSDGECRLRAVMELIGEGEPIVSVPTIQDSARNAEGRLVTALTTNTGKPFSKLESGRAFKWLIGYGWTEEKIAKELGFSSRFIADAIELEASPEAVKQMIAAGQVTDTLAIQEMKKNENSAEAIKALKDKAAQAQSAGKKTASTRQNLPPLKTVLTSIVKVIASCEDELFEPEGTGEDFKWVSVDRAALKKLATLVGFTAKK